MLIFTSFRHYFLKAYNVQVTYAEKLLMKNSLQKQKHRNFNNTNLGKVFNFKGTVVNRTSLHGESHEMVLTDN